MLDDLLDRLPPGLRRAGGRTISTALRASGPVLVHLPDARPPQQPIFLIGCPRSGTSLLFAILQRSKEVASIHREGHILWESFHHPKRHAWDSNEVGAEDVSEQEKHVLYYTMRAIGRGRRFLDKTPKNCLRIPYLVRLFPDADFVFLRRRAADNINSLLQGWRAGPRFATYRLPEPLEGDGITSPMDWSFVLIPGWRDLRGASLEEICLRQYVVCNEEALKARSLVDPLRWIDLSYEDLVADPEATIQGVLDRIGIGMSREMADLIDVIDRTPINIVTAPRHEKWRDENPEEIARVLPFAAETERKLGYEPSGELVASSS